MAPKTTTKTPKSTPTHQTKPLPTDLPIHSFPTASDFETFLDENHTTSPGIYLKLAKKSSGLESISAAEAVEVALCFGWIDGRANGLDENHWLVRYTPRRAKSLWSAKNVGTVQRLVEGGRMREAGLEAMEAAKRDGRWGRAYDGPASIEVPRDLEEALGCDERAREVFGGLNRTERYWVLHPLQTGAVSRRKEKIEGIVGMLARGEVSVPTKNGKEKGKENGVSGLKSFKVEKAVVKGKKTIALSKNALVACISMTPIFVETTEGAESIVMYASGKKSCTENSVDQKQNPYERIPKTPIPNTSIMVKKRESLSDLLDTHRVRPTEVKTPGQGQDHHHSLDQRNLGTSPPKQVVPKKARSRRE
ncbi:hypothetical protein BDW62DRAFT_200959 [Aspergillus aurantiobrunneus]